MSENSYLVVKFGYKYCFGKIWKFHEFICRATPDENAVKAFFDAVKTGKFCSDALNPKLYQCFFISFLGNVESVEEFLKNGDVNIENDNKETALHVAVMKGNFTV